MKNNELYDQRSLEYGLNAGIVVGIFLSISVASAIGLSISAVKGIRKEWKNPTK